MGIFYMDVRVVSKTKQSAIAKAAYVSNEKIYSKRDEEYKNYRTRDVKPDSFILAPSHAPEWVYNRERLWNEVEKVEVPVNARLLREIVVALPIELDEEQQHELVKEYVQDTFVNDGMVADVHIHRDKKENPHAHILLTVRPFNLDGTWWKTKSKKEYILGENGDFSLNKDGKKRTRKIDLTGWDSKTKLLEWRKSLAEKINDKYKENGVHETVSHLSYEEQGREDIGKHRLTRNEFYIEKAAKRNAEIEGVEYTPVTQYGNLNVSIDEYNKQIELLNEKIISLEEYKETKVNSERKLFDDIRKNVSLSTEDKEALYFVKNRSKSNYVDYNVVVQTSKSLDFWNRKIMKQYRELEQENKVLKQAKSLYEKSPNELYKLGFDKDSFIEDYNERAKLYNEKEIKLVGEQKGYKESKQYVEKSLNLQVELLREEFNFLYPKYQNITQFDTDEIRNVMNHYVETFKEKGILQPVLEFEQNELFDTSKEHEFRTEVWSAVLDYRNQSKAIFSLNKSLETKEVIYKDTINQNKNNVKDSSISRRSIYNATVDYLTTKNEAKQLEADYQNTKNIMYKSLIELYGDNQKDVIEKLPDRIKCALLESYLKERTVEKLDVDLVKVKADLNFKDFENDAFKPFENNSNGGQMAGDLLGQLIMEAQQNQNKNDDLEAQRRRNKRNLKGYKGELMERER